MSQENRKLEELRTAVVEASVMHVAFDGWSDVTLKASVEDADVAPALTNTLFPRGALDLALAFHRMGDSQMSAALKAEDLSGMKFREKVIRAVRLRLKLADKEAVRRGTTFFALPQNSIDGAKALWGTADVVWETLGDTSRDINWYTKRATLSGVYGSTVLFWLGDDSLDHQATWEFLDRRIENVMQFEKFKAQVNNNRLLKGALSGPMWLASQVKAPQANLRTDMPGVWQPDVAPEEPKQSH